MVWNWMANQVLMDDLHSMHLIVVLYKVNPTPDWKAKRGLRGIYIRRCTKLEMFNLFSRL